jgi:hypothetical protein
VVVLPALVRRYLDHALPQTESVPRQVRITQVGEMRQKPGGRWLRFEAAEEFAVETVGFSWRARFPVAPLLSLRVLDRYAEGEGTLEARLWGLVPVVRSRGPETAEGEALRYLAELPWVPHAMAANRELEWREIGERSIEVSTTLSSTRVCVQLEFDVAGDIVTASAERARLDNGKPVRTPWVGAFSDFEVVGGVRIPTQGQVRWELPDGPFLYWRGRVTSLGTG